MGRHFQVLQASQFLASLTDQSMFFAFVVMAKQQHMLSLDAFVALLYFCFFSVFLIGSPFAGTFVERHSKVRVLQMGSLIKMVALVGMIYGVPVWICYSFYAIGDLIYVPAKYAIINEWFEPGQGLIKANGWLEAVSVGAVIPGMLVGGWIASVFGVQMIIGLFGFLILSFLFTFFLPSQPGNRNLSYRESWRNFWLDIREVGEEPALQRILLVTGSAWTMGALLRIGYLAWLPLVLGITDETVQGMIFALAPLATMVGAVLSYRFVDFGNHQKLIPIGYAAIVMVTLSPWMPNIWLAIGCIILIGMLGGMFVIPLNAFLQAEGKVRMGTGRLNVIQNMVEYLNMIGCYAIYQLMTLASLSIYLKMMMIGVIALPFMIRFHRYFRR